MIKKDLKKRVVTSIILLFASILMIKFNFISIYILITLGTISIIEFLQISNKIFKKYYFKYLFNFLFIIYILFFCYLFFIFINYLQLKIILFTLIFGCVASDIGGFVIGKIFKGPKLTKISPKKTYTGALGSIIFSSVTISVSFYLFTNNFLYSFLIVSVLTSISCQIGDLFFSFLKRKARLKDTGSLLPGHGGILDRIDGILFGVPLGFVYLSLFN
tara:strand:+ start:1115 stop:1765 length:651 start_codon:yes stop_codon:yes gene_type:complete